MGSTRVTTPSIRPLRSPPSPPTSRQEEESEPWDRSFQQDFFSRNAKPPAGLPELQPFPPSRAPFRIGIDVGGTRARVALVRGDDLAVLGTHEWYHPRSRKDDKAEVTPASLTAALVDGIQDVCNDAGVPLSDVGYVGVGISGPVTPDGTVISAPNLKDFKSVKLGQLLSQALGHRAPVAVANDIDVAALGEQVFGAAQGVATAGLFYVGTGVGSGLVVDGRLLKSAGEIGHAPAVFGYRREQSQPAPGAPVPTVEAFVGGNSLATRMNAELDAELDRKAGQPSVLRQIRARNGKLTAMHIDRAAKEGDAYARDFLREASDVIANAMLYLSVTARLNRIVLGGGVMERCPLLRSMAMESYRSRAHPLASEVEFTMPEHGEWAGALGAAQLGVA